MQSIPRVLLIIISTDQVNKELDSMLMTLYKTKTIHITYPVSCERLNTCDYNVLTTHICKQPAVSSRKFWLTGLVCIIYTSLGIAIMSHVFT